MQSVHEIAIIPACLKWNNSLCIFIYGIVNEPKEWHFGDQ